MSTPQTQLPQPLQGLRESLGRNLDPVPRDLTDAVIRELISFIPVVGDVFTLLEAMEALRQGKNDVGAIYLLQALPGPPLPLSHIIAYQIGRRGEKR